MNKTISVITPIADYVTTSPIYSPVNQSLSLITHYFWREPKPVEFMEDLKTYQKWVCAYNHRFTKIQHPCFFDEKYYRDIGLRERQNKCMEELNKLVRKLINEIDCYPIIDNWHPELDSYKEGHLSVAMLRAFENFKNNKPYDTNLFFPPMMLCILKEIINASYVDIRK